MTELRWSMLAAVEDGRVHRDLTRVASVGPRWRLDGDLVSHNRTASGLNYLARAGLIAVADDGDTTITPTGRAALDNKEQEPTWNR